MKGFTNRFARRSNKVTQQSLPAEPRVLEDIHKEYSELLSKAAQAGYHVYVYEKELGRLNQRLEEVNIEAAQRKQLDAATKESQEQPSEQK